MDLPQIENEEAICLTYGDGVADIDLASLIEFHKGHGGLATVTAVTPPTRFGQLAVSNSKVSAFREKQDAEGTWHDYYTFSDWNACFPMDSIAKVQGETNRWASVRVDAARSAGAEPTHRR